jgi:hypothetical protein
MVFKAKQRAKTNYFEQVVGSGANAVAAQIPDYSYNWPYDFCSIVEMINIESEIEFGVDEMKLRDAVQSKLADEAANWKGGALSSMVGGGTSTGGNYVDPTLGMGGTGAGLGGANKPGEEERRSEWQSFIGSGEGQNMKDLMKSEIDKVIRGFLVYVTVFDESLVDLKKHWVHKALLPRIVKADGGATAYGGNFLTSPAMGTAKWEARPDERGFVITSNL